MIWIQNRTRRAYRVQLSRIKNEIRRILGMLLPRGVGKPELSIRLVGLQEMRKWNKHYFRRRGPTDVIALLPPPMPRAPDGPKVLGDLILCLPKIHENAQDHLDPLEREFARVLIHGILHLFGYDHYTLREARRMQAREKHLLGRMKWRGCLAKRKKSR